VQDLRFRANDFSKTPNQPPANHTVMTLMLAVARRRDGKLTAYRSLGGVCSSEPYR
jgi:hypothetical protein